MSRAFSISRGSFLVARLLYLRATATLSQTGRARVPFQDNREGEINALPKCHPSLCGTKEFPSFSNFRFNDQKIVLKSFSATFVSINEAEVQEEPITAVNLDESSASTITEPTKNETIVPKVSRKDRSSIRTKRALEKAKTLVKQRKVIQVKVVTANQGGLLVQWNNLRGFIPYSQLEQSRFWEGNQTKDVVSVGSSLVGETLNCLVTQVEEKGRLVLSEREAIMEEKLDKLTEGQLCEGRVTLLTDFGAFLELFSPPPVQGIMGLIHESEISWDLISSPGDVISVGDNLQVKVIRLDRENRRVGFSLRQVKQDPLLETLDTLMPAGEERAQEGDLSSSEESTLLATPLPGLEDFCRELEEETGVKSVTLGRQVVEKKAVSQDLQLWLSNAPTEDGRYVLLARAGKQVQEVYAESALSREGMKEAIQRVSSRIP